MGIAAGSLPACSDTASRPATSRSQVGVAVAAAGAGMSLDQDTVAGTVTLRSVEIDGSGFSLTWRGAAGTSEDAFWVFRHCMDYGAVFRPQGRRAPPGWSEPGLVRSETFRCLGVAGLQSPAESALPAPQAFDVWLGVAAPDLGTEPGTPLWTSGGGVLGGMRKVSKPGVSELSAVSADARACRDAAQKGGAIDSYQSPLPGNSTDAMVLRTYSVSAAGLLQRFDGCMARQGYTLEAAKDDTEEGWGQPGTEQALQPQGPDEAKRIPGAIPPVP